MYPTRRDFIGALGLCAPFSSGLAISCGDEAKQVASLEIQHGDLKAKFRDNAASPKILSGVASLFNLKDAPTFDAFDPDSQGASGGLNFEHIISGHKNRNNAFTPRNGKFDLYALPGGKSVELVRLKENDPWAVASTLRYTLAAPNYIDLDFRAVPHDRSRFGKRGHAIFFFADYMNNVEQTALHFFGIEKAGGQETWIAADAPKGHRDWNQGGTYRSMAAQEVEYDQDHNFPLNSWSYDYPRFSKPFYYGRAAHGMVFVIMFNKMYSPVEEMRFSLFKFKLRRFPRPAWDFQYVLRNIQEGKECGFKARMVWKKFVSAEDCLKEYESWQLSMK